MRTASDGDLWTLHHHRCPVAFKDAFAYTVGCMCRTRVDIGEVSVWWEVEGIGQRIRCDGLIASVRVLRAGWRSGPPWSHDTYLNPSASDGLSLRVLFAVRVDGDVSDGI